MGTRLERGSVAEKGRMSEGGEDLSPQKPSRERPPPRRKGRNEHRRRSSTHKKAWGDGRSPAALKGREYGARRKALSRSGLPGKRQKKKPPGGGLGGQPISPERMAWASSLAK